MIGGRTYFVDDEGNIINAKGRKLKPRLSPFCRTRKKGYGYPQVEIAGRDRLIHHLVCTTWWGVPPFGHVCHHLDGNKFNNRPSNLIWVPREAHPFMDRMMRSGAIFQHVEPTVAAAEERIKYADE